MTHAVLNVSDKGNYEKFIFLQKKYKIGAIKTKYKWVVDISCGVTCYTSFETIVDFFLNFHISIHL